MAIRAGLLACDLVGSGSRTSRGLPMDFTTVAVHLRLPLLTTGRLQLRGSAGFSPASQPLPCGKGARTEDCKEHAAHFVVRAAT